MRFEQFDVTSSNNCSRDSLVVTDGVTGQQFYTLCGRDIPGDVTSSSNKLSLVFSTSDYQFSSNNGFVVSYTSRKVIPGKCSLMYTIYCLQMLTSADHTKYSIDN